MDGENAGAVCLWARRLAIAGLASQWSIGSPCTGFQPLRSDLISSGQVPTGTRWPLLINQDLAPETDLESLCARILIQAGYQEFLDPSCWVQDLRCVHSLGSIWLLEARTRIASHALFDRSQLAKRTTEPGRLNRQRADSVGIYRRILSSLSEVSSRLSPKAIESWIVQSDSLENGMKLELISSLMHANDRRLLSQVARLFRASAVPALDPASLLPILSNLRLDLRVRLGLTGALFCKAADQALETAHASDAPQPIAGLSKELLNCDLC
jgi:hypothetical protein